MDSFAKIVSLPLLVDDVLVDLPSSQVVVFGESDIKEALVVPKVQIHLPSVIQHKHLACGTRKTAQMSRGNSPHQQFVGFVCDSWKNPMQDNTFFDRYRSLEVANKTKSLI